MFTESTGRNFDRSNQFQGLRRTIRHLAMTLCAGPSVRASGRRDDMANILIEAAKLLRAENKKYAPVEEKVAEKPVEKTDKA